MDFEDKISQNPMNLERPMRLETCFIILISIGSVLGSVQVHSPSPNVNTPFLTGQTFTTCPGAGLQTGSNIWAGDSVCVNPPSVFGYEPIGTASGSWNVPRINTCGDKEVSDASAWVGIDGDTLLDPQSTTLEQIGTRSFCILGTADYAAFFEFIPCGPTQFGDITPGGEQTQAIQIDGGDAVSATVTFNAANTDFTLSISDTTKATRASFTGNSSTQCNMASTPRRTTAEWIVEVPLPTNQLPNLNAPSDAAAVVFSSCSFALDGATAAPISSATGFVVTTLARTNPSAVPGDLNNAGDGFTISWKANPGAGAGPGMGAKVDLGPHAK